MVKNPFIPLQEKIQAYPLQASLFMRKLKMHLNQPSPDADNQQTISQDDIDQLFQAGHSGILSTKHIEQIADFAVEDPLLLFENSDKDLLFTQLKVFHTQNGHRAEKAVLAQPLKDRAWEENQLNQEIEAQRKAEKKRWQKLILQWRKTNPEGLEDRASFAEMIHAVFSDKGTLRDLFNKVRQEWGTAEQIFMPIDFHALVQARTEKKQQELSNIEDRIKTLETTQSKAKKRSRKEKLGAQLKTKRETAQKLRVKFADKREQPVTLATLPYFRARFMNAVAPISIKMKVAAGLTVDAFELDHETELKFWKIAAGKTLNTAAVEGQLAKIEKNPDNTALVTGLLTDLFEHSGIPITRLGLIMGCHYMHASKFIHHGKKIANVNMLSKAFEALIPDFAYLSPEQAEAIRKRIGHIMSKYESDFDLNKIIDAAQSQAEESPKRYLYKALFGRNGATSYDKDKLAKALKVDPSHINARIYADVVMKAPFARAMAELVTNDPVQITKITNILTDIASPDTIIQSCINGDLKPGKALQLLREREDIPLRAFSRKIGIHVAAISKMENGRAANKETAKKIATFHFPETKDGYSDNYYRCFCFALGKPAYTPEELKEAVASGKVDRKSALEYFLAFSGQAWRNMREELKVNVERLKVQISNGSLNDTFSEHIAKFLGFDATLVSSITQQSPSAPDHAHGELSIDIAA